MHICPECGARADAPGRCARDDARLEALGDDSLIGQTVGRYLVTGLVGAGGAGRVYRGVQPEIGGRVAIKVLAPRAADDREAVDRFFAEARAVNLIRHEAIVQVLDLAWLDDGRPYIVMEFLDGASLSAVIARRGPLPLGAVSAWTRQVLDALAAAHARGIVHRDLKPANLWVTPGGRARVLDFGLAKLAPELDARAMSTRSGLLLGTPHYMAPEQANARPVDGRADLYALGVVLYEACTGVRPFDAPSLYELLRQHLEDEPVPPRARRGDVPAALDKVIRRALEKKPERRFADPGEMAAALADAERSLGPSAFEALRPPPPGELNVDPQAPTVASPSPIARSRAGFGGIAGAWRTIVVVAGLIALAAVAIVLTRGMHRRAKESTSAVAAAAAPDAAPAVAAAGAAAAAAADVAAVPDAAPAAVAAAAAAPDAAPRARGDHKPLPPVAAAGTAHAQKVTPDAGTGTGMQTVGPDPPPAGMTQQQYDWQRGDERDLPGPDDPAHFDLVGYLPKARALARDVFPDADLVSMYATKVSSSGSMDLTAGGQAGYFFRTRTMEGSDARCYVQVTVYAKRIEAQATLAADPNERCAWPIAPKPQCTTGDLWKYALDKNGADAGGVAYVRYLVRKGQRVWEFEQLGGGPEFKATDECP